MKSEPSPAIARDEPEPFVHQDPNPKWLRTVLMALAATT
jgi:hypothetical protein